MALSVLDTHAVIARRGLWDEQWLDLRNHEPLLAFISVHERSKQRFRSSHFESCRAVKIRLNEPRISRMNHTVTQSVCLRVRDSQLNGRSEFRGNGESMFGCPGRLRAVGRKIFWAEKFGQHGRSVWQTTSPNIPHSSSIHFSALKFFCQIRLPEVGHKRLSAHNGVPASRMRHPCDSSVFSVRSVVKKVLREMKCATQDEANETARDLHGRT